MKKLNKDNKGFSLVELLVVIAIMVVLVGVIAPSLLSNIEKAREAKDIQALDIIAGNVQAAMTNESVYDAVIAKGSFDLKAAYEGTALDGATGVDSSVIKEANKKLAVSLNDALNVSAVYSGATFDTSTNAAKNVGAIKLLEGKVAKSAVTASTGTSSIFVEVDATTGSITVKVATAAGDAALDGKSVKYEVKR